MTIRPCRLKFAFLWLLMITAAGTAYAQSASYPVKTADGWLLWDLTTNISNWFCPLELEPLHFGGGCLWATLADDPTALLRYAVAT
jgi:hypothetical protein